jgi:amino acid adenylation domain-containing protein
MSSKILDILNPTPFQEGALYHYLHENEDPYVVQNEVVLHGDINVNALKASLAALTRKHDALRTVIAHNKLKQPRLVVLREQSVDVSYIDLAYLSDEEFEIHFQKYRMLELQRGFNLEMGPLVRLALFRQSVNAGYSVYRLLATSHHIIMDGWCNGIFFQELIENSTMSGENSVVHTERDNSYSEFLKWQDDTSKENSIDYWLEKLSNYACRDLAITPYANDSNESRKIPFLKFEAKKNRPQCSTRNLESDLHDKIVNLSKVLGVTVNAILQSAWSIVLCKYTNRDQIIFGTVVSGRPDHISGIEGSIGAYINATPVVCELTGKTFSDLSKSLHIYYMETRPHQHISLATLQRELGCKSPLFDHLFVFQNFDYNLHKVNEKLPSNIQIKEFIGHERTNYPLTIIVNEHDTLAITAKYNASSVSPAQIDRTLSHWIRVLEQAVDQPYLDATSIDILTTKERHKILVEFNNTKKTDKEFKDVLSQFDELVNWHSTHLALVYGQTSITYGELDVLSDKVSKWLFSNQCRCGDIVGVLADNSIELIVSILGILKTGAAFLTIDPKQPVRRINVIKQQAKLRLMLSGDSRYKQKVKEEIADVTLGEVSTIIKNNDIDIEYQRPEISLDHMAYVIFTSGSTGKPKGVPIKHKSLSNLCRWSIDTYNLDHTCKATKYASPGFDASIFEIFPALCSGATIYIVPHSIKFDMHLLSKYMVDNAITHSFLPTAICELYVKYNNDYPHEAGKLRVLLTGGDKLSALNVKGSYKLFDNYGPTENSVVTTCVDVAQSSVVNHIGKPIDNTKVYVYDRQMSPCPIGVTGEIYLAGVGLSDGYLFDDDMTGRVFIENTLDGSPLYKSGDIGYWDDSGNLHYVGRVDEQFQLNGQRIESGEIEEVALTSNIKQCKILLVQSTIHLFYVPTDAIQEDNIEDFEFRLRKLLESSLPSYMIPSSFIKIDSMPLTLNGKVDVASLLSILENLNKQSRVRVSKSADDQWYAVHKETLEIISKETGTLLENLDPNDNFFSIGGDSIRAMRLVAFLQKNYGVNLGIEHVFRNPRLIDLLHPLDETVKGSVADMSADIKLTCQSKYNDQTISKLALTSEQERLYFLSMSTQTTNYNVPHLIKLPKSITDSDLEAAFQELVKRHISLRTVIDNQHGVLTQRVVSPDHFTVGYVNIKHYDIDKILQLTTPFDLSSEIPVRVFLVSTNDSKYLYLDIHHIAIDIGSILILFRDLECLLKGESLKNIEYDYLDYCMWRNKMASETNMSSEAYWKNELDGINRINFPVDYTVDDSTVMYADVVNCKWSSNEADKIIAYCSSNGLSTYAFFMGALAIALSKFTSDEDMVIGSPVDLRRHSEFESVVGMLTTTLPIRVFPKKHRLISEFLQKVQLKLAESIQNAHLPFERIVSLVENEKFLGRNPLFDIMLVVTEVRSIKTDGSSMSTDLIRLPSKYAKFDLIIDLTIGEDEIDLNLEYRIDLYKKDTIEQWLSTFKRITNEILINDNKSINEIDAVGPAQYDLLVHGVNKTDTYYNKSLLLQDYLLSAVTSGNHPEDAIIDSSQSYSLDELDLQSNRFANYLKGEGVGRFDKVGILMDRSFNMMVAILAVLKSGASYMPLNPDDPKDKIKTVIDRSECKAIFKDKKYDAIVASFSNLIFVDTDAIKQENYSYKCPDRVNEPDDPAVVIHTSGSTGVSKGVVLSHRMINNSLSAMQKNYPIQKGDTYLFKTPIIFDVSFTEIFSFLLGAGRVVLMGTKEERDPAIIARYIKLYGITHINFVPTMLDVFLEQNKFDGNLLDEVKYIFSAGEKLLSETVRRICDFSSSCKIINIYGPSETFYTTYHEVDRAPYTDSDRNNELKQSIPIGRPFDNVSVYLLDEDEPVPWGAVGEICVSGDSVANGYLDKRHEAGRFVPSYFSPTGKMYRTGDLARYRDDGQLEYFGRRDRQIKIAGRRVECGEIEQALISLPEIESAVVHNWVDFGSNGSKLYAYVCISDEYEQYSDGGLSKKTMISDFRKALSIKLPLHMMPSGFIILDDIPRTTSGKVDYHHLPVPDESLIQINTDKMEMPMTASEISMQSLWAHALSIDKNSIYRNSDFFELGGTSIDIIRLVSLLKSECDIALSVETLFNNRKLFEMELLIEDGSKTKNESSSKITQFGPTESQPAVIAIPGINGHALVFKDLANSLNKTRFLCLEPINLNGDILVDLESIDGLCESYMKSILEAQPTGPYVIMGHSSGGLISLKLAQRLVDDGQVVSNVILLDSFCHFRGENKEWIQKRSNYNPFSAEYIEHIFSGFERYLGKELGFNAEDMRSMKDSQRIDYISTILADNHIRASKDTEFTIRYLTARNKHEKLTTDLLVSTQRDNYSGSVTLVKANSLLRHQTADERDDYGWKDYITGPISIVSTEGNHESILFGDNAAELSTRLTDVLFESNLTQKKPLQVERTESQVSNP